MEVLAPPDAGNRAHKATVMPGCQTYFLIEPEIRPVVARSVSRSTFGPLGQRRVTHTDTCTPSSLHPLGTAVGERGRFCYVWDSTVPGPSRGTYDPRSAQRQHHLICVVRKTLARRLQPSGHGDADTLGGDAQSHGRSGGSRPRRHHAGILSVAVAGSLGSAVDDEVDHRSAIAGAGCD